MKDKAFFDMHPVHSRLADGEVHFPVCVQIDSAHVAHARNVFGENPIAELAVAEILHCENPHGRKSKGSNGLRLRRTSKCT